MSSYAKIVFQRIGFKLLWVKHCFRLWWKQMISSHGRFISAAHKSQAKNPCFKGTMKNEVIIIDKGRNALDVTYFIMKINVILQFDILLWIYPFLYLYLFNDRFFFLIKNIKYLKWTNGNKASSIPFSVTRFCGEAVLSLFLSYFTTF